MDFPDFEEDDLTIRGSIGTSSVADLLRSFLSGQESGELTFTDSERRKTVTIVGGRVVNASSNNSDERFGESLLVRGKISVTQFLEASRLIRPGHRLGAILVEMGAIEGEDILPSLEQHVRDIVLELFRWTQGEFEMAVREIDQEHLLPLSLQTENLILEGIRQSKSWRNIVRGIGGLDAVFAPTGATDVLLKLELTSEEQEVLAQVNGRSTVGYICDVSYMTSYETCRTLWALSVLGVIRRPSDEDGATHHAVAQEREQQLDLEGIVERFNQTLGRIHSFLKGRRGDEADEVFVNVLDDVSRQYGALFDGVDLRHYGRADFDQMLANVADLPAEQRKNLMIAGMNELVFAVQLGVRMRYGAQEEAVVTGLIKEGLRRLGG